MGTGGQGQEDREMQDMLRHGAEKSQAIRVMQCEEAKHLVTRLTVTGDSGEETNITVTLLRDGIHITIDEQFTDYFQPWQDFGVEQDSVQHLPEPEYLQ